MRRFALLTVFFYVCTFAAPHRAYAVAPVVLIAAAAVGASMMSASVGTYYAQNGVLPEYVSATAGAVASAADKIFQPSYLATGVYSLFTSESLNTAKDFYIGKAADVGATIGDVVDFVKNSSSSAYDAFRNLINSASHDSFPSPEGQVVQMDHFAIKIPTNWNYHNYFTYNYKAALTDTYGDTSGSYYAIDDYSGPLAVGTRIKIWKIIYPHVVNGVNCYRFFYADAVVVGDPVTAAPSSTTDYPLLKDQLQANMDAALADEVRNALKELPDDQKITSGDPVTQSEINDALAANVSDVADTKISAAQSAIEANTEAVNQAAANIAAATNPEEYAAQIAAAQKVLKANTSAVANAAATIAAASSSASAAQVSAAQDALKANTVAVIQAASAVASTAAIANPTDAASQVAAAQVAIEAAQAIEVANQPEPEPEPEPSYPVPSTWYTKTCDLSNGLGSCIDYQQVINATSAFQSTALYQFPNLILQCLGYVEGDGCEYPPKISIDLFTRFSTGPINVDLSPFESVVKVMKFFFAILCLVGTGKATMTLFE